LIFVYIVLAKSDTMQERTSEADGNCCCWLLLGWLCIIFIFAAYTLNNKNTMALRNLPLLRTLSMIRTRWLASSFLHILFFTHCGFAYSSFLLRTLSMIRTRWRCIFVSIHLRFHTLWLCTISICCVHSL